MLGAGFEVERSGTIYKAGAENTKYDTMRGCNGQD